MRCGFRLALCACLLLIIPLYLLKLHLEEICSQYRAGAYLIDWLNSKNPHHEGLSHYHAKLGDKVIVMARLEEEPSEWVEQELPEYTSPLNIHRLAHLLIRDRLKLATCDLHCQPLE